MKKFRFSLLIAVIFLNITNFVSAQTYGKLYSKEEADVSYGPVLSSFVIKTSDLQQHLDKAGSFIMFNYVDDKLIVLGEGREVLFPTEASVDDNIVFKLFSVLIVRELLLKGQEETTKIEKRRDVLSLTNGVYTLEFAMDCPPNCH